MTKRAVIHVENTENLVEFAEFLASEGWTILSANKTEEILRKQKIPVTKENALSEANMFIGNTSSLIRRIMMSKYYDEDEAYISRPDTEENNIFIVCMNVLPFINTGMVSKQFDNQLCPRNFFVSTVLRDSFKNYENLLIITDPADYKEAMIQLKTDSISMDFRTYLAAKALNLVSAYDAGLSASILQSPKFNEPFMNYMMLPFKRELQLHCGMNAQQLFAMGAQQPQQAAPQMAPQSAGNSWTCSCGNVNTGNFCPNCGAQRPAAGWTCSCGNVNTGNFCTNCGSPKPN